MGVFGLFSLGWNLLRGNKASKNKKGRGPRGNTDPYYEIVSVRNKKGELVEKSVRRTPPDFIPANDAKALKAAQDWAHGCDMGFGSIGGFALGWESLIGFIPEVGDMIGILLAMETYRRCKRVEGGLPGKTKRKMKRNIIIDFLIGLVPIIGDIADGYFKANTKNVMLLEDYLRDKHGPKGAHNKKARWSAGLRMQEDDADYIHDLRNADVQPSSHAWTDYEREHHGDQPPVYSQEHQQRTTQRTSRTQEPRQYDGQHYDARTQDHAQHAIGTTTDPRQQSTKPQNDWSRLFGFGKKERQADPEVGGGRTDDRWAARA